MSKKTRYLLIALGFVFFLVAAPAMVLYVTGQTYSFTSGKFTKTGILSVQVDPKNSNIYIDGKLARKNSGDVRMLPAGDYEVSIKSKGYFDWSKRLNVKPSEVTWANPAGGKVFLFFNNPAATTLARDTEDFSISGGDFYFLKSAAFAKASLDNPNSQQTFTLPKTANVLTAFPDGKNFLLTNSTNPNTAIVFSGDSQSFFDISNLFLQPVHFEFSGNGDLYALEASTLSKINWQAKTKQKILDNVKTFSFSNKTLYFIKTGALGNSLIAAQEPYQDGVEIVGKIPDFKNGQIFVGFQRQVLVLLDGTLYKVTSALEPLAGSLTQENFNAGESGLVFFHNGELSFYNPADQNVSLIGRSSQDLASPKMSLEFGTAFFIRNNEIVADELDTRGHQNEYVFYRGKNLSRLTVSPDAKQLFVLDDGNLISLKIR